MYKLTTMRIIALYDRPIVIKRHNKTEKEEPSDISLEQWACEKPTARPHLTSVLNASAMVSRLTDVKGVVYCTKALLRICTLKQTSVRKPYACCTLYICILQSHSSTIYSRYGIWYSSNSSKMLPVCCNSAYQKTQMQIVILHSANLKGTDLLQ